MVKSMVSIVPPRISFSKTGVFIPRYVFNFSWRYREAISWPNTSKNTGYEYIPLLPGCRLIFFAVLLFLCIFQFQMLSFRCRPSDMVLPIRFAGQDASPLIMTYTIMKIHSLIRKCVPLKLYRTNRSFVKNVIVSIYCSKYFIHL